MTPEELDRRANDCAMEASRTRKPGDTNADIAIEAARLALSNWQPTPKPSPRVMVMREWFVGTLGSGSASGQKEPILAGQWDNSATAASFLAGYAAAVKEADILVQTLQDWHSGTITARTHDQVSRSALTTYLTAIGDDTP